MSYIRALSNPESLYIWGGHDGITIMHNVKPPLASVKREFIVPADAFRRTCLSWSNGADRTCRKDFHVEEVNVYLDTGKRLPRNQTAKQFLALADKRPSAFLIRLSYRKQFVHLWRVTWMYVVNNAVARTNYRSLTESCTRRVSK